METVFSTQLQKLRKQSGITQEQLADKLGVTHRRYQNGKTGAIPTAIYCLK